jgi:N-acetylglucosamine kinase-like BadF-type ATPase
MNQFSSAVLALDAGQTGIRTILINGDSRVEKHFDGLKTHIELFPQLTAVINAALADAPGEVTVALGMTGLTDSQSKPQELLDSLDSKANAMLLAHDSITGFLGSMGLNHGTVTAVGTGVVTLSVGEKEMARVDGWGNLIGDAGSAYWIGRTALEAGMRAYDGRGEKTALLDLLTNNFSHPENAYIELQTHPDKVAYIASFAKQVIELAETDAIAKSVVENAGAELAVSALAGARRTGNLDVAQPLFTWAGSVMKSELLRNSFGTAIKVSAPNAILQQPIGEPIDGVALLPSVPSDSPLSEKIFAAKR